MPRYDYKCETCGIIFEVKQRFSDEPLTVHDNCGGRLERLISASALQFKGSGWYINDYPKSGAKDSSSEKEKADTVSKESPKTDTVSKQSPKTDTAAKKPD